MKERYWFDEIYESAKEISAVSTKLKQIAHSFYTTGNEIMGDCLFRLSYVLDKAEKATRTTTAQHCRADCKETEQATANMVLAALAMNKLKKEGLDHV